MEIAGFVLAGGNSSRMGRDKALLAMDGQTLLERVARRVEQAAGNVVVIGPPERYGRLELDVRPDRTPGLGPLGGIDTALGLNLGRWNLVVACDMPRISVEMLRELLEAAERGEVACLLPVTGPGRVEPLCAVYHRCCAGPIRRAVEGGVRKVTEALKTLAVAYHQVADPQQFTNLNTPQEWNSAVHE